MFFRCCCHRSGGLLSLVLFLHPILVRLRRLRHRIPWPCQVNSHLLPPPHPYPCPLLPLRHLVDFQKWSRRNILQNHILPSPNVGFHRLKPCLQSRRLHRGVLPLSVQPPPWNLPRQSLRKLVLETTHDPYHAGGNHPRLFNKDQHRLDKGFRENSWHLRPRPLPAQDPRNSPPNRPRLRQVLDHLRPVIIRRQ